MTASRFMLPIALSVVIHAGVFVSGAFYEGAEAPFEPGDAAVTVMLAPSLPSVAQQAAPVEETPEESAPEPLGPERQTEPEVERASEEPPPEPAEPVAQEAPPTVPEPVVGESLLPLPVVAREAPPLEAERSEIVARPDHPAEPEEASEPAAAQAACEAPPTPEQTRPTRPIEVADAGRNEANMVDSTAVDGDLRKQGVEATVVGMRRPTYPRYSRRHGEEGTVVIAVEIKASGRAGKAEVVESSGYPRLDRAAIKAVRSARFIPAKLAGKAVTSTKRLSFTFRLEDAG